MNIQRVLVAAMLGNVKREENVVTQLTVAGSQCGGGSVYGQRWLVMPGPMRALGVIRPGSGMGQGGSRGRGQKMEV